MRDLEEGSSACCGAPIVTGFCTACMEHAEVCDMCKGTGKVERIEYECDESTGYNTIEHPTGKFDPCPECNEDGDVDDDS